MFALNETMDQLALANGVCWYYCVFRREDGYVLRKSLQFDIGGWIKRGNGEQKVCGRGRWWMIP